MPGAHNRQRRWPSDAIVGQPPCGRLSDQRLPSFARSCQSMFSRWLVQARNTAFRALAPPVFGQVSGMG
jgi:hypothetical protein